MSAIQAHDLYAILTRFGETVTYRPKHGQARQIMGVPDRRTEMRDNDGQLASVSILNLTVLKDEADSNFGGIAFPDLHSTVELDGVTYAYAGRVVDENGYGWQLEFASTSVKRMGSAPQ